MNDAQRLKELREAMGRLDQRLIEVLGERLALAVEIGEVKKRLGQPTLDPAREACAVRRGAEIAREQGIDPEFVRDVLWRAFAQSRGVQDARRPGSSDEPPAAKPR